MRWPLPSSLRCLGSGWGEGEEVVRVSPEGSGYLLPALAAWTSALAMSGVVEKGR
jgi:hypothetical protein